MDAYDYEKLGLKVGIEIHQRLRTRKLFCDCTPTNGEPLANIHRKLRASAGELGMIDPAALYEQMRGREFNYSTYKDASCLVEMDEEPPHAVNADALRAALQVAKMLACEIPDELHVMRKTVVDGSNTSGFQRTMVVGLGGSLKTSFGDVRIEGLSLEEESSQILERTERGVKYGLDRLGIPLVEIGTAPDAHTPAQAKEVAEALGMLLRSTGLVQRGIGTIRQDVNVSIRGGARVEIKGFQDLSMLDALVRNEAERQYSLLGMAEDLRNRAASASSAKDVTRVFSATQNRIISQAVANNKRVYAFVLKGFGGLLKRKISWDRTFGRELASYAMVQGVKGMIHTDEDMEGYGLTREFGALRNELGASEKDAICIIAEDDETAKRACAAVIERALFALSGVPEETRAPNADATSSYARPLPGGARLYPETDVPPIVVDRKALKAMEMPESLDAKQKRLVKMGVPEQAARELVRSEMISIFEEAGKINAKRAAELLTSTITSLRREGVRVDRIASADMVKLLRELEGIPKEAVLDGLKALAEGKPYATAMKTARMSAQELADAVDEVIRTDIELVNREGEAAFKKLMGPLMDRVRGRVPGEAAAEALKRRLKSFLK
ncbi:MAG: Glu-tRNA(Gln) amidotransferase subunit GatE [Candidatus Aenigmatarchaeota archaeon]|nr:MAG: Glu-tRNA(Gln) amidotransferase subunit GatE [Candidatus Aenigmarchaeota archaeon]